MDTIKARDEKFMRAAIAEAREAFDKGEVPVGAVVVCGDRIVGRGHNQVETLGDVTAHAEMLAVTAASQTLGGKFLNDCVLYVTVEPCPMCAGACGWCRIGEIVYGAGEPKRGFTMLEGPVLHPRTVVRSGVLEGECSQLIRSFFAQKRTNDC